jgi:uncharacterized membrane protein SpoIIM required for sporulation
VPPDAHVRQLQAVIERAERGGVRRLEPDEVAALPRLYRYAATRLSASETSGRDRAEAEALRGLLARAHAILYRDLDPDPRGALRRALDFVLAESPRAIRAEWRALALSFGLLYGLAALSYFAVRADLDLAWSLLNPAMVSQEISQLQALAPDEQFRGNFTFGFGTAPAISGYILAHNMAVGVVFFASALVPPVYAYALGTNGLMLGTYTAVAGHWGRAGEIWSILACHGTLELQAIALAGAAGLVLARGALAPGPWSRRTALRRGATRSWALLAPVFPLLFFAGLIEGFVSPHAPTPARLAVAATSGVALLAWALLGGRAVAGRPEPPAQPHSPEHHSAQPDPARS